MSCKRSAGQTTGRRRRLRCDTGIVALLERLDPATRRAAVELLPEIERDALDRAWPEWAHEGQLAPARAWSTWVIKAGRGFGKTRAGAEWIAAQVAAHEGVALRIALVGASLEEARKVMVEGKSGLLAVAEVAAWEPSRARLTFRSGAQARLFSGASPDMLRGPEHHFAWCDELAKWDKPRETWDMLQLGMRLGESPQTVVTTTPRSGAVLQAIIDEPETVVTGGPTSANPHTSRAWKRRVTRLYAGTRLGRQELDGEMLPEAGALWSVELIERCRISRSAGGEREATSGDFPSPGLSPEGERGGYSRTLIAVDPPTGDGTCGIVAVARAGEGDAAVAHVLADHSVTGRSPEGWTRTVAAAAAAHGTREVVAERNQGGEMVEAVLHAADPGLRVRLVHARSGKSARAEPVALLFEAGRAWLHGRMPELEAQMLGMIAGGGYEGPGKSPDRADAMVWGVSELMKPRAEPRVRVV